ncbi:alpha/beta hydrolase [Salisediminibacterium halotolerans]|uniref:Esterase/lipase n=1 Tax=Salisediminibacterium halotolerans TaxID=517425 RepID=A0A1H9VPI1_9BACI|nr:MULTISPECIES: alpha/beta fold hydrolase [Salisediminibacterium]RLJ75434.1 esterase/lipase [Actinophytocola xinjiangensis]RPE89287.1 esterase/lipase [Salisediminibacterium halotolerans]TWG36047.1 esterase/lipase [Salisediminibacterium halotolerans]SES23461.1 Esterase/lipase [Salisediminibacterium haloalkalitolerans]GEL07504.1 carboxylesterase [Salisediminibacterium halotolerans]
MIGCLILHGFAGSREDIQEIETHFTEKTNWLVYVPDLPGHDGTKDSLKAVTYKHWLLKAKYALEELLERCDTVYLIGFSMGGVIASYLSVHYRVDRLVLISAAAFYLNPKQLASDLTGWAVEGLRGELSEDEYYLLYRDKLQNTPVKATIEFAKMVRKIRPHFSEISVPTLIIQGEKDGLVPVKSAEYIYNEIRSEDKEIYFFPEAKHYIWHSGEKESLLKRIDQFLHDKQ